jgi:hypothetical protein
MGRLPNRGLEAEEQTRAQHQVERVDGDYGAGLPYPEGLAEHRRWVDHDRLDPEPPSTMSRQPVSRSSARNQRTDRVQVVIEF